MTSQNEIGGITGGHFNSHPHEEDDANFGGVAKRDIISTHILTKRMTLYRIEVFTLLTYFNSHPHEEDDGMESGWYTMLRISTHILTKRMTIDLVVFLLYNAFQLTSSRRGWPWEVRQVHVGSYFNSHPHEEDDLQSFSEQKQEENFNSHPHEEDDSYWLHWFTDRFLFQLTSSRRGWQQLFEFDLKDIWISTHILTKRMTLTNIRNI